jgi:hypothetical protein
MSASTNKILSPEESQLLLPSQLVGLDSSPEGDAANPHLVCFHYMTECMTGPSPLICRVQATAAGEATLRRCTLRKCARASLTQMAPEWRGAVQLFGPCKVALEKCYVEVGGC